jgi:hypothetical protein
MGKNALLGQWGWMMFVRKARRNFAATVLVRKLSVQV